MKKGDRPLFNMAVPVLLLYDGLCGFCNGTVQWLLKHDKSDRFRFAAQQSGVAAEILLRHGIDRDQMLQANSVYLVLDQGTGDERVLQRSDVTIRSLEILGGFWKFLGQCLQIVPKAMRDSAYNLIARNRFRLAGRYDECPLPAPAERLKFLGLTDS